MKKIILFILKPLFIILSLFFNILYYIYKSIIGLFTKNNKSHLNTVLPLEYEEFKDGKFIKKEMEFLDDKYYKITEILNIIGLQINEAIYEYKIEGENILIRVISLKEGGKYKIKDNTVLVSDIKIEYKNNKYKIKEDYNKEINDLKNKCKWHQEKDYNIKTYLYKFLLNKSTQDIKNTLRKELENLKLIDFELNELSEKYGFKYSYDEREQLYKFTGININDEDISEKNIKLVFDTIQNKYGIHPTQLKNKIRKLDFYINN